MERSRETQYFGWDHGKKKLGDVLEIRLQREGVCCLFYGLKDMFAATCVYVDVDVDIDVDEGMFTAALLERVEK